ncbi:crossover suppressor on 2 of Manheim [Cochliomyia hominivorax]
MSFSQSLLISQHDYELFAPSWEAALSGSQNLNKSLKHFDIEKVNIVKTCDKLCLVLGENTKRNESSLQVEGEDQCTKRNSNIPFRAFTNIWFGALKIYQQQVNTLLRLSQDLLSRSCNYDIKPLEATKRKSSSKTHKIIKKRRLTLSESTNKTYFTNTNYSELLDDLEKITKDSVETTTIESTQTLACSITQLQIREITIREINTTTFHSNDALDEDSGFGEATHEEITDFFNFIQHKSVHTVRKTPTKRKASSETESMAKQTRYFSSVSPEPVQQIEILPKTSPLKRLFTPTNEERINKNDYKKTDLSPNNSDKGNILEFVIKRESKLEINPEAENNHHVSKKRRYLIIDNCTKIDNSIFIEEMKNFTVSRKRIFKSFKTKKTLTALELLTRFNRRSLKLSLTLKQKVHLTREQFEYEYLNLLNAIFNKNVAENWASEIYPKWKCFQEATLHQKRKHKNKSRKEKNVKVPLEYLNFDVMDNNNNVFFNENGNSLVTNVIESYNEQVLNNCIQYDWNPYGVMMNLLNLWRSNETHKISAEKLFKLAENRFDRALGFYSLLDLSKTHFVKLTTFSGTITLQYILMGKTIKNNF